MPQASASRGLELVCRNGHSLPGRSPRPCSVCGDSVKRYAYRKEAWRHGLAALMRPATPRREGSR